MATDARAIIELLRCRHKPDEWAAFVELRAGTGYGRDKEQRLDFFAINTWPSKGQQSIAYEVKVSRADFAKEIDNPHKRAFAESVATECYFAMPDGLVQPQEIPEGWGLLCVNNGGLRRIKIATQREPRVWPFWFIASIARRSSDAKPVLPDYAWVIAGKEIGDKELLKLAEETTRRTLDYERNRIATDAKYSVYDSPFYKELTDLRGTIQSVCGYGVTTGPEFLEWWRRQKEHLLDETTLAKVREARNALDFLMMRRGRDGGETTV